MGARVSLAAWMLGHGLINKLGEILGNNRERESAHRKRLTKRLHLVERPAHEGGGEATCKRKDRLASYQEGGERSDGRKVSISSTTNAWRQL